MTLLEENVVNRIERISSVHVKKGHVSEALTYDKVLTVKRKGKEVKEKLESYKSSLEKILEGSVMKMLSYLSQLGDNKPTEEPSSYIFEGIRKEAFGEYPKMFSWKEIRAYNSLASQQEKFPSIGSISDMEVKQEPDIPNNIMEMYNDCARKVIGIKADCLFIEALCDSIQDTQVIELNPKLIKILI